MIDTDQKRELILLIKRLEVKIHSFFKHLDSTGHLYIELNFYTQVPSTVKIFEKAMNLHF